MLTMALRHMMIFVMIMREMRNRSCIVNIVKRLAVHLPHLALIGRGMSQCIHQEMKWRDYWPGISLELWCD